MKRNHNQNLFPSSSIHSKDMNSNADFAGLKGNISMGDGGETNRRKRREKRQLH